MKTVKAWYFSTNNKRLRYDDGRVVRKGITHRVEGEIETCRNGLHASTRIVDALAYGRGDWVWRVELSGEMDMNSDKIAAAARKYIWGFNAGDLLRRYARMCALDRAHLIKCSASDKAIIIKWLKTGDPGLRSAAYSAARSAAYSAAYSAADSAADSAAYSAADSAARSAADSAAYSAARDKQNRRLGSMVMAEAKRLGLTADAVRTAANG